FGGNVRHLQLNAVPAARDGASAVGHGPPARAGRAAQEQPHAVTGDRREGRGSVLLDGESEMSSIELDRGRALLDQVTDADGAPWFPPLFIRGPGAAALCCAVAGDS